jgi:hypothetical protein
MNEDLRDRKADRRSFLKGLAAAGGLVAAAGASQAATSTAETLPRADQTGRRPGYRVTPHVAKYYDKARF